MNLPFDKQICMPTKLLLLSKLMDGEFTFQECKFDLNITDGNLSATIRDLEKAGLVRVEKDFVGRKVRTTIFPTDRGKKSLYIYADWLRNRLPFISSEKNEAVQKMGGDLIG